MVGLWELGSQPHDNPAGSAAGSGAHACLRYYSGTDTYWSAASSDGTSTEVTATAVAPATDTAYTVEIQIDAGGTVRFYLNGSLIATHTTHVPASTDPLGVVMQVRRFSGASTTALRWPRLVSGSRSVSPAQPRTSRHRPRRLHRPHPSGRVAGLQGCEHQHQQHQHRAWPPLGRCRPH